MIKIFAFFAILTICGGSDVESIFNKCKNDNTLNTCLVSNVNKGWPKFVKEYNLDKIPVEAHQTIPYVFEFWVKANLEGFENIRFNQFYVNLKNKTCDIIYSQPKMSINASDYTILGNFLGNRFFDHGHGTATYTNGIYKLHYDYAIVKRAGGEEFIKLTTYKLSFEAERLIVVLKSSVSAEQGLRLQKLFNDNWRIFNLFAGGYIADILAGAYTPIIQNYLNQIPFKSLFKQ